MRVPTPNEMRYLVYTTLGYGAQGISYYVYSAAGHTGGIALADGTPTPIYDALRSFNSEFVAVAAQTQPLHLLAVYHSGHQPPGTHPVPTNGLFQLDPPFPTISYNAPEPVNGVLLSCFADASEKSASHVLVVNLDYAASKTVGIRGPSALATFNPASRTWTAPGPARLNLELPPGGGALLRVTH
jgi:hypothetical protein